MEKLREEFEKARDREFMNGDGGLSGTVEEATLWAACWMAERIALAYDNACDPDCVCDRGIVGKTIRQFAKELS